MYRLFGVILAGGLVLGHAASAEAQVGISVGNPYTGNMFSLSTGNPYGMYGFGANGYSYPYGVSSVYSSYYPGSMLGTTTYSSGYAGYAAPATSYFSTGYYPTTSYYGPAYGTYSGPAYGTYAAPAYGYRTYYGYGMRPRGLLRGIRRGWW